MKEFRVLNVPLGMIGGWDGADISEIWYLFWIYMDLLQTNPKNMKKLEGRDGLVKFLGREATGSHWDVGAQNFDPFE